MKPSLRNTIYLFCFSLVVLSSFDCGQDSKKEAIKESSSQEAPLMKSGREPALSAEESKKSLVYKVSIQGPITPAATEKLSAALTKAEKDRVRALLVTLDTPGGLVNSMDDMIRRILSARVPVLSYVSPPGAACGSAGVYIMYASHLTAMAPATNIGSATPVSMGGGPKGEDKKPSWADRIPKTAGANDALNMKRKLLNHARAQIRSLAQHHGRNAAFGEKTITEASNVTAQEAHRLKAVDILADSEDEFLQKAHGRRVRMGAAKLSLDLKDVRVVHVKSDFRQKILDLIANPNLAHLLMMLGILGILAEVQNPGLIFPGAVGAVSLLLGLYAMQTLPLDYTGLALIGLAFIFFVLEIYIVSYGLLSFAGLLSLVLGSLMLVRSAGEFTGLSLSLVLGLSLFTGLLMAFMVYLAAKSQRVKPVSAFAKLLEEEGTAKSQIDGKSGTVFIHGELWQARSLANKRIPAGVTVRIVSHEGLKLIVEEPRH